MGRFLRRLRKRIIFIGRAGSQHIPAKTDLPLYIGNDTSEMVGNNLNVRMPVKESRDDEMSHGSAAANPRKRSGYFRTSSAISSLASLARSLDTDGGPYDSTDGVTTFMI